MPSHLNITDPARTEIRQFRSQLRDLEQRRDALLVETAALRLWEEASSGGRVPKWVAEAAIRRRQAEVEELGGEIQDLISRITVLCDRIPENVHGTPSLELEPVPALLPEDGATESTVSRILHGLNRARGVGGGMGAGDTGLD